MVDITGIGNQPVQSTRNTDRASASARAKDSQASSGSGTSGDSVEISAGVREGQTVGRLVDGAKATPEIRSEAIARAKETLDNGGFEGRDVSRKAAENILDML